MGGQNHPYTNWKGVEKAVKKKLKNYFSYKFFIYIFAYIKIFAYLCILVEVKGRVTYHPRG